MLGGRNPPIMKTMLRSKRWIAAITEALKEGRRQVRLPAHFTGTMSGPFGAIPCTGIDLTRNGAGVHSPQKLPVGALVFLRLSDLGLMGFATVRHCSAKDDGYMLGLQFREALSRERGEDGTWDRQRYARATTRAWDDAEF